MKKISLLLIVVLFLFTGCRDAFLGPIIGPIVDSLAYPAADPVASPAVDPIEDPVVSSDIDGYQKADFEKYTSATAVEDYEGDLIYVEGQVALASTEGDLMMVYIVDEDDQPWAALAGYFPEYTPEGFSELSDMRIRAFGTYEYYTIEEGSAYPIIYIIDGGKIEFMESNQEPYIPQISSDQEFFQWIDENGSNCIVADLDTGKYNGQYVLGYGLATDSFVFTASKKEVEFNFHQRGEHRIDVTRLHFDYSKLETKAEKIEGGVKFYGYVDNQGSLDVMKVDPYEVDITPQILIDDYKASCKTYDYKTIARDPSQYEGERAFFTGKVVHVMESGNYITLRVNVTKGKYGYDDTIYVTYRRSESESRILKDDVITMWGKLDGLETYDTLQASIPRLSAEYIQIK